MKARRLTLVLAGVALGLAVSAAAPAQELSVSFAAGGFFPSGSAYRDIYGPGASIAGDVWLKLKGPFGFAAGFGRLSDRGFAVPTAGSGTDAYPLEFRRTSVPVIAFYQVAAGPAIIRLGAGPGFHSYRETWTTAGLEYAGHKAALRFVLAASVRIAGRISVFCESCYESIRTGQGTSLDVNVNVGGAQVLGGLSFRIF
ncbi:MAG: hypothetical protein ABFD52_03995 [Acidobacteriota bacterium]